MRFSCGKIVIKNAAPRAAKKGIPPHSMKFPAAYCQPELRAENPATAVGRANLVIGVPTYPISVASTA